MYDDLRPGTLIRDSLPTSTANYAMNYTGRCPICTMMGSFLPHAILPALSRIFITDVTRSGKLSAASRCRQRPSPLLSWMDDSHTTIVLRTHRPCSSSASSAPSQPLTTPIASLSSMATTSQRTYFPLVWTLISLIAILYCARSRNGDLAHSIAPTLLL